MRSISYRLAATLALILVVGLTACAPKPAAVSSAAQGAPPAADATAELAATPTEKPGSKSVDVIRCDQLIPPDEANSLMTGLSPKLSEETGQGETACAWQYISKSSGTEAAFRLQVEYGGSAVEDWTAARQAELAGQPPDLVVISIDGLGDENYTWISTPDNQRVVYVRAGSQALVMHYATSDILFLGTESGIIDMADRVFNRMNP